MIVDNSLDELKKRENALTIIKHFIFNKNRNALFDLTGLSGGFIATDQEINLLETYIGPAVFEEEIQKYGKIHLCGEKILPVNRTSSGILATILALVEEDSNVIHFLPEFPAHPSIIRACNLVNANYFEFDNINKFHILENTSLIIITGSTMDHKILDENLFKEVISQAKNHNIPVFVDDASGARLRTTIFNQEKAFDLGADLVITSTDKLMNGPRGGLMTGTKDLIDMVKVKANQFGLEAQPPIILAMLNALKEYDGEDLINAFSKKEDFIKLLETKFTNFQKTPTGVMISVEGLYNEVKRNNTNISVSKKDLSFIYSMILLKNEGIITIPAVSMPGASATIRFDLSTNDGKKLDLEVLFNKIINSFNELLNVVDNEEKCKEIVFNN
ncbi:TIGR03576 family pyridoxal phosphate-dependent enzyme [Methanobrevibacter sp. OttesenSCG-928-K11]|nr:TIGR03576 family pyridoxal phosphate-dependent enzyme [Methanobrevibacter sp. OttesenSCG-928-K11]MDL2270283.1 TIGR03576 family pyridoxal phosphate-dependent enzyme [Methanobrevibacter sp. OttesenSCG-928-I08]